MDTLISLRGSEGENNDSDGDSKNESPLEHYLENTLNISSVQQLKEKKLEEAGYSFYVNWNDAQRLDRYEQTHLKHESQNRNKLTTMEEIKKVLFMD